MTIDRRRLLTTAAAAGLAGCATAAPPAAPAAPAAGAEGALARHLDDLAERLLIRDPEQATSLGLDKGPREGLKGQLRELSREHIQHDDVFCANELRALEAFPDEGLSPALRLHKAVTAYALRLGRDAGRFTYGDNTLVSAMSEAASPYVVSQQGGAYASTPEFLDSQHSVETEADADAYLQRLNAFARNLRYETLRIADDAAAGVIPPDFILANAIGQQEGLLAIRPADSRPGPATSSRPRSIRRWPTSSRR
jgi:uncharacterized protein (DUF885 family)